MITEDYCSFELSKLLKEKGFDEPCYGIWHVGNKLFDVNYEPLDYSELREERLLAPTHQMAMKWLRDYPNYIFIGIKNQYIFSYEVYHYHIRCKTPKREIDKVSKVDYRTYEEAVEAAIKYCLTELI